MNEKPFKIVSASAGSGKTYTLVKDYLSLILGKDASSAARIMAMTFTNKAALEMKARIIKALDDLSNPKRRGKSEKEIKDALKYQQEMSKAFKMPVEKLQKDAQQALSDILHRYEDFYVMTIDKFNLRLIRSFAMDLDLDANFKVIINEDEILQHVIDDLIDDIDPEFSSALSQMFFNISLNRIDDGKGWNFERELYKYASIIQNENTSKLMENLEDEQLTKERFQQLKEEIEILRHRIESLVFNFRDFFLPLKDQFCKIDGKKVHGSTTKSFVGNLECFDVTKAGGIISDSLANLIDNGEIDEPIGAEITTFKQTYFTYLSQLTELLKIKESFYYMVLLREIQNRLEVFRNQEQVIRISEFNRMISELLRDEKSPFIYEKLGVRFEHFLLDEFQDTSRLQWLNIVPLVEEAISKNQQNLIVGDPKQAIYRFRAGIAEQFVALPKIYNPENDPEINRKSAYFSEMGKKESLDTNYRSNKDVVEFNNDFFKDFVAFLHSQKELDFTEYYNDIVQNVKKEDQRGYIELISEDISKTYEDGDSDSSIEFLLEKVQECIDDGYQKGDICVLGSTGKWCNEYALALTAQGHSVVSVDSLSVNSDQSVQLCLLYLNWRNQPTNELLSKRFVSKYFSIKEKETAIEKYMHYFETRTNEEGREYQTFAYKRFIDDYFVSMEEFLFPFENLYALLQKFYQLAKLSELDNPYLHHLSDLAFDYDMNNGPDLSSFIEYYATTAEKSSIQTPENNEAIKVMTSHKSKGLEFKVVIIPRLNEQFMKSARSSFLIPLKEGLAYTTLSKTSNSEALSSEYKKEYKASLLDKLNLNYVAFTRAKERLYLMNTLNSKKRQSGDAFFGTLVHEFLQGATFEKDLKDATQGEKGEQQFMRYCIGEKREVKESSGEERNVFSPLKIGEKLWFPDISLRRELGIQEEGVSEQIRYGKQLHLLLSEYSKFTDDVLQRFIQKGWIEKQFETRLKADLVRILNNEKFTSLHRNAVEILNEQSIIVAADEVVRPDKVIVKSDSVVVLDFKTGLPSNQHIKQVSNYCHVLREAGYENVLGYVLYTTDMNFVQV